MDSTRRGTNGSTIPSTLEEAYGLRDASATSEERAFYEEHVYRLRAEGYRSRGIRTEESVRRRERTGAEVLRAGKVSPVPWWKRVLGGLG